MIKIYQKKNGDNSTRKAKQWMVQHAVPYELHSFSEITTSDLRHIFSLSTGFDEIVVSRNRARKTYQDLKEPFCGMGVSFNEMLEYLKRNPTLFKQPIIFDENRLLVGYNEEEIRTFLPKNMRQAAFQRAQQEILA